MTRIPDVEVIDFETKGIKRRPKYPPVPVGVSIQRIGERKPTYYAWGHPCENNCDIAKPRAILRDIARSGKPMLFHNGKFDYDVAVTHMGMPEVSWDRIHDTLFLLYLDNPHAFNLSLKPSAERLLGMPPEEQDDVVNWLIEHQDQLRAEGLIDQELLGYTDKGTPKRITASNAGSHIAVAPGKLVGRYAGGDVVRTLKLFRRLWPIIDKAGMLPAYDRERRLMPILLRNEREGVPVDVRTLSNDIDRYTQAQAQVDAWLRKRLKTKELNFDAPNEVADALDRAGIVTEWNVTATGKRSTSKANLTPGMFKDKRVASALGYRQRVGTCLETFMKPWMTMAQHKGRIYTNWNQVRNSDSGKGTRTGRLSSNPNFQNLPKDWYDKADGYAHPVHIDVPELPFIRKYVVPEKGHLFCHRDYNQQELRILAHFEDGKLMHAYREEPRLDVHNFVGGEIQRITGAQFGRREVKILNFGMMYGQGAGSLSEKIGCDVMEARTLRKAQQRALPDVQELDKSIKAAAKAGEPIRTWGGRLYYCEEPVIIDGRTMTWEYKLLNYLIQGSAADATKEAMIRYDEMRKESRMLLSVHDEINISAPRKAAKREMEILREAMEGLNFDVPMISDGKIGANWYACK